MLSTKDSTKDLCIVLSGGSVLGFGILGTLQYLDEIYGLHSVHSFFGTSVGSIFSYMLCIGLKPLEIIHHITRSKILEQIQDKIGIETLFSQQQGLFDFEPILEELEVITLAKYGKLFTFKTLYDELGKEFGCVTVNYTKNKPEYKHYTTSPDLSCLTALQMSSSIPFVFNKCVHEGFIYIDGGFVDNFPIRMATFFQKTRIIGIFASQVVHPQHTLSLTNVLTLSILGQTQKTIKKFKKRFDIIHLQLHQNFLDFSLKLPMIMEMFSTGYKEGQKQLNNKMNLRNKNQVK